MMLLVAACGGGGGGDETPADTTPVVLPLAPDAFYKGKGWNGWKEFLED